MFVIFSYDHVLTLSDEVRTSATVQGRWLIHVRAGPIFQVWRSDAIADTVLHSEHNFLLR